MFLWHDWKFLLILGGVLHHFFNMFVYEILRNVFINVGKDILNKKKLLKCLFLPQNKLLKSKINCKKMENVSELLWSRCVNMIKGQIKKICFSNRASILKLVVNFFDAEQNISFLFFVWSFFDAYWEENCQKLIIFFNLLQYAMFCKWQKRSNGRMSVL